MSKRYAEMMVKKNAVQSTLCDACGKRAEGDPDDWVGVRWGHNDWGNDSVESGDDWDACSPACLLKLLRRAAEDYDDEYAQPTFYLYVSGGLNLEWAKALGALAADA